MSDTRVSQEDFTLDTSSFDAVYKHSKELAERMRDLKNDLDQVKDDLVSNWVGEGQRTFEKKYRVLSQQFGDLRDDLWERSEELLKKEEAYIQADVDLAKTLDGKDSRY